MNSKDAHYIYFGFEGVRNGANDSDVEIYWKKSKDTKWIRENIRKYKLQRLEEDVLVEEM